MRRARRAACRALVARMFAVSAVVGPTIARLPEAARAQSTESLGVRALPERLEPVGVQSTESVGPARDDPATTIAALFSLAVPGAGQRLLGQKRGWAYLALEAVGWAFWVDRRSAAGSSRDAYRDLAWASARIQNGPRRDGSFPYYETVSKWTRSGVYDQDPLAPGLQPEEDPETYNGSIWARAVGLYLPGGSDGVPPTEPAYQTAVAYYGARAYPTDFLWDWSGAPDARVRFAALIVESDRRFQQATNILGAIIANHLVSGVDAYLSARGRANPVELRATPGPFPGQPVWSLRVRLGTAP